MALAKWYKIDFHTHTPESKCFPDKKVTPKEWLKSAKESGINAVVVSDHNSVGWISKIEEVKSEFEDENFKVFYGIELCVSSDFTHFLIIFDDKMSVTEIEDAVVSNLGLLRKDWADTTINVSEDRLKTLCTELREKIFVIPAHFASNKGLGKSAENAIKKYQEFLLFSAVEVRNEEDVREYNNKLKNKAINKAVLITGSDNPSNRDEAQHSIEGFGKMFTWIKLSTLSFEGLRQVFIDPEHRCINWLSLQKIGVQFDPNETTYNYISGIAFEGISHMTKMNMRFSPNLNCIVGGRGTGKSTIVDAINYGVCNEHDLSKCRLLEKTLTKDAKISTYFNFGSNKPYSSPKTMAKDNKERIHYIRKASNSVEPSDDEEKDLFNLANRVPFDDRVNHEAEMSDLNITLIQNYLKEVKSSLYEKSKAGDFVEVCRDMNIICTLPEYTKPKNVGLMFFSMEPDKFFPYTQIDVVQFPSGLGGNDIIEKTFRGPIQQQLREALQYIRNVVITEKVVKHPDRAEADRFFNYPYAAIEEALSNAVYHRAYDEREPIEVRIEADRIEIVSFPGPDRSVTIEGLKSYRVSNRRYRNRRIGDFLKELHLTEGRNTGFKKILDALEANGSPKPEFETDDARTYFITRLFIHEKFLNEELKESQKGAEKEPKKGAERKKAILELLAKNPTMTQAQLMEQMELTRKQVQKDVKELQEEGMLKREGSNRNGRYAIFILANIFTVLFIRPSQCVTYCCSN